MSKKRRKKDQDERISESWLIPYADILTLCLALFIVLFAMSDVNAKKFEGMAQSFNQLLASGTGIFDYPSPIPTDEAKGLDVQEKDIKEAEKQKAAEKEEKEQKVDRLELESVQKKVNSYIQEKNLTDNLNTSLTDEGLLVTIRDNVLFASGSAEVRSEDVKVAKEISQLLVMDPPRNIVISGHTDNVPIRNVQFDSNWELSVMRAVNFMKIILDNDKLEPRWFSAKGFGEYQPVAPNTSSEGRAKNRRVEILIQPRGAQVAD